nr:hypothetical protein [uncultured Campylobacter sp.]
MQTGWGYRKDSRPKFGCVTIHSRYARSAYLKFSSREIWMLNFKISLPLAVCLIAE